MEVHFPEVAERMLQNETADESFEIEEAESFENEESDVVAKISELGTGASRDCHAIAFKQSSGENKKVGDSEIREDDEEEAIPEDIDRRGSEGVKRVGEFESRNDRGDSPTER